MLKKFDILIYLVVFVLLAVYISCSKYTIIDIYTPKIKDTTIYTPRTRVDTTSKEDTSKVPITFTVSVEDWKEVIINK